MVLLSATREDLESPRGRRGRGCARVRALGLEADAVRVLGSRPRVDAWHAQSRSVWQLTHALVALRFDGGVRSSAARVTMLSTHPSGVKLADTSARSSRRLRAGGRSNRSSAPGGS